MRVTRKGELWEGFSIERSEINHWLTNQAVNAGAKLFTNTEMINLESDDKGYITKIIAKRNDEEIKIKPKIVIAADGIKSTVAKALHLVKERKCSYAHITSFEMSNINIDNPNLEQIFFDDFTPKGFAYIFPKSSHRANIGTGSVYFKDKTEKFSHSCMTLSRSFFKLLSLKSLYTYLT